MKQNFVDVLNIWLNSRIDDIHTVLPGEIVSYEGHSTRKAKVKSLIRLKNSKNKIVPILPIDNVPVMFPSTNSTNILFPLNPGDGCLLLFSEAAIGNYLSGSGEQEADDNNKFQLTDCICIPGLWSFNTVPVTTANNNDFYVMYENAKIQIVKGSNDINISSPGNLTFLEGTEPFVLGTTLVNLLTTYLTVESSITPGNEAANAAALNQIKAAAAAFLAQLSTILSAKIKGL